MINTSLAFRAGRPSAPAPSADQDVAQAHPETAAAVRLRPQRDCDFISPAGLYVRETRRLRYVAFARSALAVRHAVEKLTPHQRSSVVMEVGNARFNGVEIEALYHSEHYPLRGGDDVLE